MHVLEFLTFAKCRNFFCYLTKKWFRHRRFLSNFKNSRNTHRKHFRLTQFSVWLQVSGSDSLNCLNGTLLKTFSWKFPKTFKICYFTNTVALIKLLHCRPLSDKLPSISEHSKETFVLESVCAEVRNSVLQICDVREKGTVLQRFFWNFWNFRRSFPFLAVPEKYLLVRY